MWSIRPFSWDSGAVSLVSLLRSFWVCPCFVISVLQARVSIPYLLFLCNSPSTFCMRILTHIVDALITCTSAAFSCLPRCTPISCAWLEPSLLHRPLISLRYRSPQVGFPFSPNHMLRLLCFARFPLPLSRSSHLTHPTPSVPHPTSLRSALRHAAATTDPRYHVRTIYDVHICLPMFYCLSHVLPLI